MPLMTHLVHLVVLGRFSHFDFVFLAPFQKQFVPKHNTRSLFTNSASSHISALNLSILSKPELWGEVEFYLFHFSSDRSGSQQGRLKVSVPTCGRPPSR